MGGGKLSDDNGPHYDIKPYTGIKKSHPLGRMLRAVFVQSKEAYPTKIVTFWNKISSRLLRITLGSYTLRGGGEKQLRKLVEGGGSVWLACVLFGTIAVCVVSTSECVSTFLDGECVCVVCMRFLCTRYCCDLRERLASLTRNHLKPKWAMHYIVPGSFYYALPCTPVVIRTHHIHKTLYMNSRFS